MASTPSRVGPVIVSGGCGLVGYHIVKQLLSEGCGPISVASRNPNVHLQKNVTYHACDIFDKDSIADLFEQIKPQVVFHSASPLANSNANSVLIEEFYNTNVTGTKNLLDCATNCSSVKAFVFTSSAAIYQGNEHIDLDETAPVWDEDSNTFPYMKAKAIADGLVLQANTELNSEGIGLLTVALRPHLVYGECDSHSMPEYLEAVKTKRTNFQVGSGRNTHTPIYAGNLAQAHVLAARKLLEDTRKVEKGMEIAGQAFNVHDGEEFRFWDYNRLIWSLAGDDTKVEAIHIIPAWFALFLCGAIEWILKVFTFGQVHPPIKMNRLTMQYLLNSFTYNMDKARERLGYNPVPDLEVYLRRSIEWELNYDPKRWAGLKVRKN